MLCLGIETSCDDTCVALVENGQLRAQLAASQARVHALFGGVVPELASREHHRLLGLLFDTLMADEGLAPKDLDCISVARGPGLLGSLLVGVAFAKGLSLGTGARLVGGNHLHAHLLAYGLEQPLVFPALGLLVSGGHTHLYAMHSPTQFTVLGKTLDDAAGEAFDKAGKMMGLPYPAGVHIDTLAREATLKEALLEAKAACQGQSVAGAANKAGTGKPKRTGHQFPRPYLDNDTLDFSFSGLKTSMAGYMAKHPLPPVRWNPATGAVETPEQGRAELGTVCAAYSQAVVDTLVEKTRRALQRQPGMQGLVLAGGVAANSMLRTAMQALAAEHSMPFLAPRHALCADNAAMVAYLGWLLAKEGFYHTLSFEAIPRGKAVPSDWCQFGSSDPLQSMKCSG